MTRLPDDRDMDQVVRSWLREEEDERPADRNRQVGRIMGRVDETRQRRGPWRFLPFGRGSKPVDRDDEDLYVAARGGLVGARRSAAPSLVAVAAVLALLFSAYAFIALRPTTPSVVPGASPTYHTDDEALFDRMESVWSGDADKLQDVVDVYAADAMHTVLWFDQVDRYVGHQEIWAQIRRSHTTERGPWIPLPDGWGQQRRYLGVTSNLGGIACVVWIRDDRITRHDCILPMSTKGYQVAPGAPPQDTSRAELEELISRAWRGDREAFDAVVAPDIVHHVAWDDHTVTHEGADHYWDVGNSGDVAPQSMVTNVDLPAPGGELRWANFSDVGNGSLCTFWARGAQVVRHDCIVPTSMGGGG